MAVDIFISYAGADNEKRYESGAWDGLKGWVDCFRSALLDKLMSPGTINSINIVPGSEMQSFKNSIDRANVFVAIVSAAYLASSRCAMELEYFEETRKSRDIAATDRGPIKGLRIDRSPVTAQFVTAQKMSRLFHDAFRAYGDGDANEFEPNGSGFRDTVNSVARNIDDWIRPASGRIDPPMGYSEDIAEPAPLTSAMDGTSAAGLDYAAEELLRDASALGSLRSRNYDEVSTRKLLFSLAQSEGDSINPIVRSVPELVAFSRTLRDLAGDRFQAALDDYFQPGFRYALLKAIRANMPVPSPLKFSESVSTILNTASSAAAKSGTLTGIPEIIDALLASGRGKFHETLKLMQVDLATLAALYRMKPGDGFGFRGRLAENLTNDAVAKKDVLAFERYASALKAFIMSPATSGPIAISIQAPWGGGKSTLMRMVEQLLLAQNSIETPSSLTEGGQARPQERIKLQTLEDLAKSNGDPKQATTSKCVTVWFNAWKYESANQLWAGLVDSIIRDVAKSRPDLLSREQFFFELNRRRISPDKVRKVIADRAWRLWWRGWGAIATAASGLVVGGLVAAWKAVDPHWPVEAAVSGAVSAFLTALGTRMRTEDKARSEDAAATQLADLVDVPDYSKEAGFVHSVEHDLTILLKLSGSKPLIVFVDDLDRCSPASVSLVMSGLNLFLAGDFPECYFVIGMDAEMVAAALEVAHADVVAKLPIDARVPVGWRFMDKFITLPFVIPPSSSETLESYMDTLYGTREESVAGKSTASAPVERTAQGSPADAGILTSPPELDASAAAEANETKARPMRDPPIFDEKARLVQDAVRSAVAYIGSNPRDLKRFVNALRLNAYVSNMSTDTGLSPYDLRFPQIVTWTILAVRWPEVARWIRRGSAARAGTGAQLARTSDRLDLLGEICFECGSVGLWQKRARKRGLDDKELRWLGDPDLLALLANDARRPKDDRLSAGVNKGLW